MSPYDKQLEDSRFWLKKHWCGLKSVSHYLSNCLMATLDLHNLVLVIWKSKAKNPNHDLTTSCSDVLKASQQEVKLCATLISFPKTIITKEKIQNWLANEGRWIHSHNAGIVFFLNIKRCLNLQHALMKLGWKYFKSS